MSLRAKLGFWLAVASAVSLQPDAVLHGAALTAGPL